MEWSGLKCSDLACGRELIRERKRVVAVPRASVGILADAFMVSSIPKLPFPVSYVLSGSDSHECFDI